jgi:aspartate/methionine/tyrosine aminotransferase
MEALTGPQQSVTDMVAEYQVRRDLLIAGLNALPGVHCLLPQGAFYAFPNIHATGLSSRDFAEEMLGAGVALLPGTAFGQYGEGYVRLSYANSQDNLRRALERMHAILRRRLG